MLKSQLPAQRFCAAIAARKTGLKKGKKEMPVFLD
jgi:hypothetical protein